MGPEGGGPGGEEDGVFVGEGGQRVDGVWGWEEGREVGLGEGVDFGGVEVVKGGYRLRWTKLAYDI